MTPDGDDPLLDACLREILGGETPPDLSRRILEAHARRKAESQAESGPPASMVSQASAARPTAGETIAINVSDSRGMTPARRKRNGTPWWTVGLAVGLLLCVGAAFMTQSLWNPAPQPAEHVIANSNATQPPRSETPDAATPVNDQNDTSPTLPPANAVVGSDQGGSGGEEAIDHSSETGSETGPETGPEVVRFGGDGAGGASSGSVADDSPRRERRRSSVVSDQEMIALIDELIERRWEAEGVDPSSPASDAEWHRRVFLDVLGRVPSVDELQAYVGDRSTDKKLRLVDQLLSEDRYTEEYARNWTTVWTNLLIGRGGGVDDNSLANREGLQQYLRRSFQQNKPYDQMVHELVSADGANTPGAEDYNGAVNFVLDNLQENATTATAKTARYFLGMQVQCTQCHDHPFNDWKQNQFWRLNAFFRQTRALRDFQGNQVVSARLVDEDFPGEDNRPGEAAVFFEMRNGELEVAYPEFVDGHRIDPSGWVEDVNRRDRLAEMVVDSEFLGQALANRLWSHFFGYGFTKPVDDMGPHNPPSHPELLARLGEAFADSGHDLKRMMRWIVLSRPYSLSSQFAARSKNAADAPANGATPLFSRFYLRQMRAEELYESLLVATEAHRTQTSYEEQERVKADWLRQFTLTFGTDEGDETTTFNGTIPQVLTMMNGDLVARATSVEPGSFLRRVVDDSPNSARAINHLYQAALARPPRKAELDMANQLLAMHDGDAAAALQDVWWALLNSNEFILNH